MEEITNLIMGGSVTLDAFVIVRIVVVMMGLEMFAVIAGLIGKLKG